MSLRASLACGLAGLVLANGCGSDHSGKASSAANGVGSQGTVLYTIGRAGVGEIYGLSGPTPGFGVTTGLGTRAQKTVEIRDRGAGSIVGAGWIDSDRILADRAGPHFLRSLTFHFDGRHLIRDGISPVSRLAFEAWSPSGKLVASEPIARCGPHQRLRGLHGCSRLSRVVYVQNADGSHRRRLMRGDMDIWTADGRLIVAIPNNNGQEEAVDVRTGKVTLPFARQQVAAAAHVSKVLLEGPRWSADGRYVAALFTGNGRMSAQIRNGLVIARADGTPVRVITSLPSPRQITMFAWSPVGHRLAWTTGVFGVPGRLLALTQPTARVRGLFAPPRPLGWFTWSPDGSQLLVDDHTADAWRLISADGTARPRRLHRLGGEPLWCCPVNAYNQRGG